MAILLNIVKKRIRVLRNSVRQLNCGPSAIHLTRLHCAHIIPCYIASILYFILLYFILLYFILLYFSRRRQF